VVAALPRSGRAHRPLVAALAVTIAPLAGWATVNHLDGAARHAELAATVPQAIRAGYARSARCEACHPAQYHSWHRGYHRTMTQYASPEAVRGNFADVTLEGGGYTARLSRTGDEFFAELVDPLFLYQVDNGQRPPPAADAPWPTVTRRISMVTGSHHMQAYWVPSLEGNSQMSLPFTYLIEDQRWVPRGEVFLHPPDSGRHAVQVWNVSCIRCHTTGGQPLALGADWKLESKVAEIGIACEACHGPAEAHVAANQNPLRRYWQHLRGGGDPTIVNPARLPAARASEVCGQCHSLSEVSEQIELGAGKTFIPGQALEDSQPLLRPLHPSPALDRHLQDDPLYLRGYFWSDGTIRVSSRDFSGMIESKCVTGGTLSCGSCHSLHDSDPVDLLAAGKDGDAACVSCHPTLVGAAAAAHTHHRPESPGARCTNCHMPYTVYGLLKGIRNHRIDSPRITGASGADHRPNACNLCHVDRSLSWAAQQLTRWYHQPARELTDDTPAAVSWLLSGDAVLRAIAAWQFGWDAARRAVDPRAGVPYLVAALDDPYAAVRYVAARALRNLDPANQVDYLASPEVRRQAAEAILGRWVAQTRPDARTTEMIDARIRRLIEQRDNTPVRAME
jgi:predicted CXXCH cytochrome family protein